MTTAPTGAFVGTFRQNSDRGKMNTANPLPQNTGVGAWWREAPEVEDHRR